MADPKAGRPGPVSAEWDHGEDANCQNACWGPPVSLAVGSIVGSSGRPGYSMLGRDCAEPTNEDSQESVAFLDDGDDDDESRPGYAFLDHVDESYGDEIRDFVVDWTSTAPKDRGHDGPGSDDDDDDNASFATSGSNGGSSLGTGTSGSSHDRDRTTQRRDGERLMSPRTQQLLADLMVRMRESRQLAQQQQQQQQQDQASLLETSSPSAASPVSTQPAPCQSPTVAMQPRCRSRLGRSTTSRLYPNVVASLGGDTPWSRTNHQHCVGLLRADTLTDSDDEDDKDGYDDASRNNCGRATNYRFEIWRVHASCEGDDDGDMCFQMWRARTDGTARQSNSDAGDLKSFPVKGPGPARSDARRMTRQVPVVCEWIRKLRNENSDSRIMILSTAEDAAARQHPSYQVVSNLILNHEGPTSTYEPFPSAKSQPTPVAPLPDPSISHAMRKLWTSSTSGSKAADPPSGKRMLLVGAAAPPHGMGLSATVPLERSQQLALDRLRCWKRRRPGCVVEASTDVSSSATVASF
jgi:hypothetical protein